MTICLRPECDIPLNTGSKYCSRKCAAMDRKRLKENKKASVSLDTSDDVIKSIEGLGDKGKFVLQEAIEGMSNGQISIPLPSEAVTYGDWVLTVDGRDLRPSSSLDYDIIGMMLKSGPVIFALEIKRAQVFKVFSEGRFRVISPDKELEEVANEALKFIMPKMAADFTWSSFAYGSSFQEKLWERKTKYELGLSKSKASVTSFVVPKVPAAVNPQTIDHIIRDKDTQRFGGFAQKRKGAFSDPVGIDPIKIEAERALVIPFNERFRNLWGESFLKTIYPIWLWYEIILRTMDRYMERMAMPVTVGKAPSRATVTVEGKSTPVKALDLILAIAGNVAKSNAVAIPSDKDENGNPLWELEYLTASERGQAFIDVLGFLQQEMLRAALSADRSATSGDRGVGSRNIGEVHAKVSAITAEMILLQYVHYLNKFFMPDFSLFNRGINGPPIWLKTQPIDPEERELATKLMSIAGNAPPSQEALWMINWRALMDVSNIPSLSEQEVTKLKEKLREESLQKQEEQQELMQKFSEQTGSMGGRPRSSNPGQPSGRNANVNPNNDNDNDNKKNLEDYMYIVESVVGGEKIPLVLGENEIKVLMNEGGNNANID